MSEDTLSEFHKDLVAEIEDGLSDEEPFSNKIFTRLMLERLEEAGQFDGAFPLYQEGPIRNTSYRIDGYTYDEERTRLDLFTTIYSGDLPATKLSATEVTRALEKALRFASACVDGLASLLEPSNTDASDLARLIEDEAKNLSAIRIVLLTDGIVGKIKPPTEWREKPVEFEAYDIVRLFRVLGEGETRADISVDLVALAGKGLPCLHVPAQNDDYDAYFAVIPGEVLSQVYERYGVRLLELNVRAFLGLQGRKSVNAELRRTISEQPSMFLAFNNGIVATVDDLDVAHNASGGIEIRSLKGLQIVNGGQTTASLHRARRKDSLNLQHVAVPVKIIKVGGADLSEMVSSISRAANRQNTVQLADFSANDPFHQQIETLANTTWLDGATGRWFYERARGSYLAAEQKAAYKVSETKTFRQQTPKQRRLSKLDVARYLAAWESMPDKVCLGGQKNFQMFMQRLKDSPIQPLDQTWFKRLIAIAVLYRAAEKKIKSMKFPAYASQITAYVIAGISDRSGGHIDFDHLWSKQAVSTELEHLIAEWAPTLDAVMRESAGQKNPSEWYKKADCWKAIREKLPELSNPPPPELSYPTARSSKGAGNPMIPKGTHAVADDDPIARCMDVPAAIWLEVAERGQQTDTIHWIVADTCRTMAGYAEGGWQRKPTEKQAKSALEAVIAIERAGLVKAGRVFLETEGDQD
jgi:hypothetical protein